MKWFCFSWKTRIFHTWRWVLSLLSCTGVWDRLGSYYGLTCPLKCDRGKQLIFLKLLHSLYLPQRASVRNSWNNVWCVAQRFENQPINSRYSSKHVALGLNTFFSTPCTHFWSKSLWTVQNLLLFFGHSLCWWKSVVSTLTKAPGLQGLLLDDWIVSRVNCSLEGERFTILQNIQNATNLENCFQRQILFITYGALLFVDVFS